MGKLPHGAKDRGGCRHPASTPGLPSGSGSANFENPAMNDATLTPTFTGMPFFVYPVADIGRSRAFYGGLLGLTEIASWEDQWVEYAVGEMALALSTTMKGAVPGARGGAVALETAQFDEAVAMLKAAGVTFALEPVDTGVCMFARFEDPDGNHLVLHRKHTA